MKLFNVFLGVIFLVFILSICGKLMNFPWLGSLPWLSILGLPVVVVIVCLIITMIGFLYFLIKQLFNEMNHGSKQSS
ncbi:hypothetical protein DN752_20945 [Echinicola strongylocentroti]|uniref:Uncharacterized protein n=1 Tax=Echinicola strongylocentroti TaxID=1795355 RepID=A0A2Z4INS8_9BACT|nr:hypothetical protein [Echinicola strongylocentroti]AWW32410.1 hypothetical protein DN752_20945 [Echinicola strongylocentroti]